MVIVIDLLLLGLAGFLFFYLAVLSILALTRRECSWKPVEQHSRFAVVVPAHNEEVGIARTLRSIFDIQYPRQWFDVIVIADNCTDRTADISRDIGATVYERTDEGNRGKGYAQRWCFDHLLGEGAAYDAFIIIDADSTVSHNFLDVMNSRLKNGANVIQCADVVQPEPGAWSAEITRLGFLLYNVARPLGRSVLGLSAGLRGNGMCFSREILQKIPWQAYSLAEDLEYSLMLVLHGHKVIFAPETQVVTTMPKNPKNAESQRARWETGRYPLLRTYTGKLLWMAMRQRSLVAFDALVDLVTPPIVNLFALSLGMCLLHAVIAAIGLAETMWLAYLWLLVVVLGVIHVFAGLIASNADKHLYAALLNIPRYMIWKFVLYAKLIHRNTGRTWIRTTREGTDHVL